MEDGREVFDDDLDDEGLGNSKSKGSKGQARKKNSLTKPHSKSSNIKNMFLNIPNQNKEVGTRQWHILLSRPLENSG